MTTTRLSTKGQLILPKEVRDRHGWEAGTELVLEEQGDAIVLRPLHRLPPTGVDEILGCAGYEGPPRTLEEMDAAIARGIRSRHRRNDATGPEG